MTVIADTGALYALADDSDVWHARVIDWWEQNTQPVLVPVCVVPEVTYLLQTRIGPDAEDAFVRSIVEGELVLEPLEAEDVERAAAIMQEYADLRLGFVDASTMATAERLRARQIVTTDRRHFSAIRPRHARSFLLVP